MEQTTQQRIVIGMFDGMGTKYYRSCALPHLNRMEKEGFYREVQAVMPSVTNTNNVAICCGAWPDEHGITGNSYLDEATGEAEYMENADFIRVPTILERAARCGIKSALLTCKKKTINLLAGFAEIAIAAEEPAPEFVERYGQPANIYSREINYWLWKVAVDLLTHRPDIGLIYVHITDYPMHEWAEHEVESQEHLQRLDELVGEAVAAAPDAAFYVTADHSMNRKRQCWDLAKACAARGTPVRFALSAERDRYVKHHRTFGGTGYVWLNRMEDLDAVRATICNLAGVEQVLTKTEAARELHLLPERIGDLTVLGDIDTVFGEMPHEHEELDARYRSHGSLHELEVPLIVYNNRQALQSPKQYTANLHLTRWLFREGE